MAQGINGLPFFQKDFTSVTDILTKKDKIKDIFIFGESNPQEAKGIDEDKSKSLGEIDMNKLQEILERVKAKNKAPHQETSPLVFPKAPGAKIGTKMLSQTPEAKIGTKMLSQAPEAKLYNA